MNLLILPGSLRRKSSSNAIMKVIVEMITPEVEVEVYDKIGTLPHFNDPDEAPEPVNEFRMKIKKADAVLICTPEYAFGIPGSLKNALDWTVGSGEFIDKPVGLVTASSQGERGHAALLLVLGAISAKIIEEATLLISFVRAKLDEKGNVKDVATFNGLQKVVQSILSS
ncbi:MAG TPA: NAD(P)H-dependent oxidoreductase [Cyclobacteriaceae bacterium]|nr:NAD(P)H-dependent oxidoreductase [Cyclobacteriaceae bacterium]